MSEAVAGSNPWETQWRDKLSHIDELVKEHKIGAAIQYIFTSFFIYLGKFTEDYRMDRQAKIMHDLQQIQSLRNRIQQDFQSFNTVNVNKGSSPPAPTPAQVAAAQDALTAYNELKSKLSTGESQGYFTSEFVTGFESHFFSSNSSATIFQATDPSSTNASTVTTDWINAWFYAGSVPSSGSPSSDSGLLGVINNQFNEAKTTSQSSIVQSKLNYWSKQDTTDKSVVHMGLSATTSIEKTANNNLGK